jgi:hypothetical protein
MSIFIILTLIFLFIVFFVFVVFYLTIRFKRAVLAVCSVFIVIAFLLYTAAYLSSGITGYADTFFATLRGLFSTARMFSINDDYDVLNNAQGTQWLTESVFYKNILWCCYISALIIVQTALITLFGRKLIDSFRLTFGPHKEVYIIKGSDKNALLLAENIVTHEAEPEQKHSDKKRLIVFLLEEDDDEKKFYEKASRFGGIVRVLDRKHDLAYHLKKAKLKKRKWPKNILNIDFEEVIKAKENKRNWYNNILINILKKIDYIINGKKYNIVLMPRAASSLDDVKNIAKYAKDNNLSQRKLYVFVFTLSEWDREKIEEITQARKKIKDVKQKKKKIDDIKQKEETKLTYPCTFHIINEIDLLTRQMIEKHPPYSCPGLNFSGGKAARDFTVMILGFGPVGQSALLRLIMNGQFMGSNMRAIIIDIDIDNLKDCFMHRYPSIDLCCKIEPKNINVQQNDFFTLLEKEENLDYIVAALHSDGMNKQIALDIKHHYERKGKKALPFIAVAELNGSFYEKKQGLDALKKNGSLQETEQEEKIFVFGSRDEVYKESVIIRPKTDSMAREVNRVYSNGGQLWHELEWFKQESNRASADFIPAMLKLASIDRDKVPEEGPLVKDNDPLAETLAQTEHLRWNAFHAAMGYRPISIEEMNRRFDEYKGDEDRLEFARRDSKARLQVCLVHWDELDKISEAYRELERIAGKEPKRDFKNNDRDIIKNIPLFLKAAKIKK